MNYVKQIFTIIEKVALLLLAWLDYRFSSRPSLDPYKHSILMPVDEKAQVCA